MKTSRTIAWTALAGMLVIGPLTMTRAHDVPSPGPFNHPLPGMSVGTASGGGSILNVDLRVAGLSGAAIGQALQTTSTKGGLQLKRVVGLADYIVLTTPGSSYAALIRIDVKGRAKPVAHLLRERDEFGRSHVIILVIEPKHPTTVLTVPGLDDGLTPQGAMDAADASALLFAAGMQL